jgi:hypothetical protein
MSNQASRIQNFLQSFDASIDVHLLNISNGIIIRRFIQDDKVKFKSCDLELNPKDYLDIKNLVKKKYPQLLKTSFIEEESLFLLVSPFYADIIESYKEELFLISIGDIIPTEDFKVKKVGFEEGLNKICDDLNYLVLISKDDKIVDKKIFYCDRYKEYLDALNNATFSQFLSFVRHEEIKDEKTLISCLAKEGIPRQIQDKYLDFWYDYNQFLDIIDELCLEIERQKIDYIEGLEDVSSKKLKKSLIKFLKYDVDRALDLLDDLR